MRNAILILVLVNLLVMGWTHWIDVPAEPVVNQADAHLPKLVLANEAPPERAAPKGAVNSATPVAQPPAAATAVAEASTGSASPPAGHRCLSVGPFNDLAEETRAAGLLQQRGFTSQARTEPGEVRDGFWVYVAGIKSAADESQVLRTLQEAGINDAHAIAPTSDGRRVSVGLFIERPGAERRARAVEHLGFAPDIVDRHKPGTVYWVDLDLGSSDAAVPTEGLVPATEIPVKAEPHACAAEAGVIRG